MSRTRSVQRCTTWESDYRGYHIYVSDEGSHDPDWETRTIYHSITTPEGHVVMDSFVSDTGDTLETYLEIMKQHVDAAVLDPCYWDGE